MQICTRCGEAKEAEGFGFKNKASARRHRKCKVCVAAYGREHYARNREAYITRNVANMRVRRRSLKERVWHLLAARKCVDCGEHDLLVLEFDHLDPLIKRAEIYYLVQRGYGWSTIEDEISRCEVRCANCHRRRTAAQFNWPKLNLPELEAQPSLRAREKSLVRPHRTALVHLSEWELKHIAPDQQMCCWCARVKPLEFFHHRRLESKSRNSICIECFTAYRREHYRLNRKAYIRRNQRVLYERGRKWLLRLVEYLIAHPCVDCGERDPVVLDFDHLSRDEKRQAVSFLARSGYPWATVMAEVSKCQVRCANCHRRRTAVQFDWPKLAFSSTREQQV